MAIPDWLSIPVPAACTCIVLTQTRAHTGKMAKLGTYGIAALCLVSYSISVAVELVMRKSRDTGQA